MRPLFGNTAGSHRSADNRDLPPSVIPSEAEKSPTCHLLQWPHSKAHNVLASPCHHSVVGLWMFSNGTMSLQKSIVKPILPPA